MQDTFDQLLRTAILGVHRQGIPPELAGLLESLGVDRENSPAEQLLEATALLGRINRGQTTSLPAPEAMRKAKEEAPFANPRFSRALELTLSESYRLALPEVMEKYRREKWSAPPHLLSKLLAHATAALRGGEEETAKRLFAIGGVRGRWLAAQHPEWSDLLPPQNWASAYQKAVSPARRAVCLRRWRVEDPAAARKSLATEWKNLSPKQQETLLPALLEGLSPDDFPFLEEAREPRRKAVRYLATQTLLFLPNTATSQVLTKEVAPWVVTKDKQFKLQIPSDHTFPDEWGLPKKERPDIALLGLLPPRFWSDITQLPPLAILRRLATSGGKSALQAVLRSILFYGDRDWKIDYCRYLILLDRPQTEHSKLTLDLYEGLDQAAYATITEWALKNVDQVIRPGGALRQMSLLLPHPWPDPLSKMLVAEFKEQLRYGRKSYGFGLNGLTQWKLLPYRMDPALFPWLRQELYEATERDDQLGNVATKMLQVLHFRRELRKTQP